MLVAIARCRVVCCSFLLRVLACVCVRMCMLVCVHDLISLLALPDSLANSCGLIRLLLMPRIVFSPFSVPHGQDVGSYTLIAAGMGSCAWCFRNGSRQVVRRHRLGSFGLLVCCGWLAQGACWGKAASVVSLLSSFIVCLVRPQGGQSPPKKTNNNLGQDSGQAKASQLPGGYKRPLRGSKV